MNEWTVFRLTRDEIAKLAECGRHGRHYRAEGVGIGVSKTNSKSRIERNPPSPRLRRGSSRFAGEEEEEE